MGNSSTGRAGLVSAGVTLILWSSAFACIRIALAAYGPLELTLFRFSVASATFALYALGTRMKMPERRDLPMMFGLGVMGITIYHTALNLGEVSVPAGTASFIIAISPAFTAMLSVVVLREVLGKRGWLGIGVSLAGAVVMAFGGGGGVDVTRGALLILLAAACVPFFFVYQKPLLARYGPIALSAYVTWMGTLPLLIFARHLPQQLAAAPAGATAAAIYIGIFPAAVAYVAWAVTLKAMPASRAATLLYLNPVLAVGWGWALLRELPSTMHLVGGLISLAGVVVVNARAAPASTRQAAGEVGQVESVGRP